METTTQGFVLQAIPYGDSSLVVKMFTRQAGLQTYMVKGARNRTSRNRVAFFQPMTFLRFVQNSRPPKAGGMGHLKELELDYTYQSIHLEMKKSAILIYVAELKGRRAVGRRREADSGRNRENDCAPGQRHPRAGRNHPDALLRKRSKISKCNEKCPAPLGVGHFLII